MNKDRLEAFSDGIFAIAITLLVLTIPQPNVRRFSNLTGQLLHRWPSFAAYAVSFAVIGIMWLNHQSIFSHLSAIDRRLTYLNFLLLLTVVFVPYPTGILGDALYQGKGTQTAAVFYSLTMAMNALAWVGLWLHASTRRRLLADSFPEAYRRTATLLFSGGAIAYFVWVGVAFFSAYACLALEGLMAVYYAFDPLSRYIARRLAKGDPPDRVANAFDRDVVELAAPNASSDLGPSDEPT
ncbi:MAG TPA: TMEM175 family protein [Chloroflexota bacterium]|nr:TMEM175 family protein [Chloroflexota bacterium]